MQLQIDPASPIPLYRQIGEQLRAEILSGGLKQGDLLPGEMQISIETGVSRMTARQALAQLASEGLVERRPGRGTFVTASKSILADIDHIDLNYTQFMRRTGLLPSTRILRQETRPASKEDADWLQIAEGDPLVFILRLRLAAGQPIAVERMRLPAVRAPGLDRIDLNNLSLHKVLEERYNLIPDHAKDVVEISTAEPYEAGLLQIGEGAPVARVNSLEFLADQTPLIFNQITHRSDRFRLILQRSRRLGE